MGRGPYDRGSPGLIEADSGLRSPLAIEAFPDVDDDVRQPMRRVQARPHLPYRGSVRRFVHEVESGLQGIKAVN